ncbi:arabinose transporter [Oceanidesulfovibrio marinus]|uniref:Arabinose transporter n=1 Tax=Oceanidesulfovibrio marinus TaxID=370038 RepID=A0A6P1ZNN5_9BACT|nr:arabinose transporter [Oceanidesulfovibrio marinus]QJT08728.1 MFS transporter [Oceanidesulfovibrio marinus]TVM36844.1 arabinose transporter [Oceanidesulfovibrio marinus]
MSAEEIQTSNNSRWSLPALLPLMGVVFASFLVIGMAIPVVPLYVSHGLGLGTFMVGLAVSCEFATALFSRIWAGHHADTRGAKRTVIIGLIMGAIAGLLYVASLSLLSMQGLSILVLLLGRGLLGAAESFVITGALSWGLATAGVQNAGKVIAWLGTALWAGFAAGAPAGTALYDDYGFISIALGTIILPLLTLLFVVPLTAKQATNRSSSALKAMTQVLGVVWLPGIGLALTAVGFGAITTFGALLFAHRDWSSAWLVFTSLSVAFILGRILFGHLPDKLGGARVALVSVLVEAFGVLLIWLAPSPTLVFIGAAFTGLGYSLVYPGFGLVAVHLASPENYGLAMGTYTAFLDLSLGLAGPSLGLVAAHTGLGSVFLVSAVVVLCATPIALYLLKTRAAVRATSQEERLDNA